MKKNSLMRIALLLGLAVILIIGGAKLYWDYLLSPVTSTQTQKQRFIIYQGESTKEIAGRLEKEGFIRSSDAFVLFTRLNNKIGIIQAGEFKIASSQSAGEILNELSFGVVDKLVTLLEGWRVEEIAEKLQKELGIDKEQFIKIAKSKEGYLFPDTYLINPKASPQQIVSLLENNFNRKFDAEIKAKVKQQGLTEKEAVILASIVEREGRSDQVRTEIASILLKRFDIEMGLNADATIQYIVGYVPEEKSWWKRHLSKSDLQTDSPYNTYLYRGLPPDPISNPSLSSLKAVANADASTPYLYYYHDSNGNSYYGRTLDEHNENVANHP